MQAQALAGLQRYWGYRQFRPLQGEIVAALLQQQDVLALLPTGAGKSLCFQLPALLQPGLSLVVSPLVALMENQVEALQAKQVPAALFHSEQPREHRQSTLRQLEAGQLKLLYLSPESLLSPAIWPRLEQVAANIQSLVVDEAHCITQWGSNFRPVYRRLGTIRSALKGHPGPMAIAAFTATADVTTQQDIQKVLGLQNPQIFRSSPYRKNLFLRIERVCTLASRRDRLRTFLRAQGQTTGLVYTRSRRDSEEMAAWLQQQGYRTAAYHAGLSAPERRRIEQQWLSGQLPFVLCTSAFGMGVDKPDVRWVCHFHPPLSLSEYLQEIGRAGRDGNSAQTLLLASEPTGLLDPTDKQRQNGFMEKLRSQTQLAHRLAQTLPQEGNLPDLLQRNPQAELALAVLHQQGQLRWVDPFRYRLIAQPAIRDRQKATDPTTVIAAYFATRRCRWQFLLDAFGFMREAQGLVCGHCDRCCKRPSAAP